MSASWSKYNAWEYPYSAVRNPAGQTNRPIRRQTHNQGSQAVRLAQPRRGNRRTAQIDNTLCMESYQCADGQGGLSICDQIFPYLLARDKFLSLYLWYK